MIRRLVAMADYAFGSNPPYVLAIVPKSGPSHGSHNSEIRSERSSLVRDQGRSVPLSSRSRDAGDRHHAPWQARRVLIGFESEEDWFEYRLEHDPRFLRRIEQARNSLRAGRGTKLEDIDGELVGRIMIRRCE
jgi:hypothetical protein